MTIPTHRGALVWVERMVRLDAYRREVMDVVDLGGFAETARQAEPASMVVACGRD